MKYIIIFVSCSSRIKEVEIEHRKRLGLNYFHMQNIKV